MAPAESRRRILLVNDVELNRVPVEGSDDRAADIGMSTHIARPVAPHALLRQIEMVLVDTVAKPDCWQRDLYDEWVARLGSERMLGFLARLLDQCRDLRQRLTATARDDATIHRLAHDLASTGGTLGFSEVTRCCRSISDAHAGESPSARRDLVEALNCAIARLDRFLLNNGAPAAA